MAAQTIKVAGKVIDDTSEKIRIINEQLEKLNGSQIKLLIISLIWLIQLDNLQRRSRFR